MYSYVDWFCKFSNRAVESISKIMQCTDQLSAVVYLVDTHLTNNQHTIILF
jgi:hypothetical protein